MTHDFINHPVLIDRDLSDLLMLMKNEKVLDRTIVFMLADHGLRFGSFRQTTFQGMVEERLRKRKKCIKIQEDFNNFFQPFFSHFFQKLLKKNIRLRSGTLDTMEDNSQPIMIFMKHLKTSQI